MFLIAARSYANPCTVAISLNTSGTILFFPATTEGSSFHVNTGANGAGTSCHWTVTAPSFISLLPGGGGGGSSFDFSVNFTVFSNPDLAARNATIQATQTEDSTTAPFTISQAASGGTFNISSVSPSSQAVSPGTNANYTITISRTAPFAGAVSLSSTFPGVSFSPAVVPAGSTTSAMTVSTTTASAPGTFAIPITAVNGSVVRNTSASLTVNLGAERSIVTATNPVANTMEVEYIANDAHVHQFSYNGAWSKSDLSAITGAANASLTGGIKAINNTIANTMEIHYIGADQHVHTLWYDGSWHTADLSFMTGAPNAALNSSVTAAMDPIGNTEDVEYIGTDSHVHQLWYNGLWHTTDLTNASGAAANADSSSGINTILNTVANAMEVHYIGTDHHVYSLWFQLDGGGVWHESDLTLQASGPLAASPSPITSSVDPLAGTVDLEFISADHHVQQLWYNGLWHPNDLTTATSADPNADNNGGIHTLFNTIANSMEVHYIGTNQHVYALWYNGAWHESDLTLISGALTPTPGSQVTSAADPIASTEDMEYVGAGNLHVYQLFYNGTWHPVDLTALVP